ncbi:12268_t:CDS:1, partial [Dentiscutata erythropus]
GMVYTLDVYDFIENYIRRKVYKVDVLLDVPTCQGYTTANTCDNIGTHTCMTITSKKLPS